MRPRYTRFILVQNPMLSRVTKSKPNCGAFQKGLFTIQWKATLVLLLLSVSYLSAQESNSIFNAGLYDGLKWRNIGPFRGGRSNTVTGVPGNPMLYYMGSTGGGVWKTEDAGQSWKNISDGFFKTGSVGALAVAPSNPNVLYVGMGEHAVRGVMTSSGDGVYKSLDAGKTWTYIGLPESQHIAEIRIHPTDHNVAFVAVQGALYGPSKDRGVYRTMDGGESWEKIFYINETTGACDLTFDPENPRILYAGMWDHQRTPWTIRSGGPGSGIYKSVDGGINWEKLCIGLPKELGKVAVTVSPANPNRLYANIEAQNGGVFKSDDAGATWIQTTSNRVTIARAWYYIEIFADPIDPELVYVLNAPMLKSTDGGKTFKSISNPHGDQHDLWINPDNPDNIILGNDGGATITFNGGKTWSTQQNQATAQFYRIITDNRFPYHIYAGQQDNSTMAIASRTAGSGIGVKDWYRVAGGESAFLAFDPDNPRYVYGGSYQGNISVYDHKTKATKDIMAYPIVGLAWEPKEMKYRFNWNAPIVAAPQDPSIIYHTGNVVFRTSDGGINWDIISPDLTRNDTTQQGPGGHPYTNEGAGGENYNTISYLACSPHQLGVIWVGTDDGLVHVTQNEGQSWSNVTPPNLKESLINAIEVSPHDPATAYVVATRYKFNDQTPYIYRTTDFGKSWDLIVDGLASNSFARVVREDRVVPGLLYAGTERGLYISFDHGTSWNTFQLNLPVCTITDLTIRDNDLVAATSGRAFWILDDLGSIQQSNGQLAQNNIQLFKPKPSYKIQASTPAKPVPGLGQNPQQGVIIDYYLPEELDSTELTLEILDNSNKVIRSYSNLKDKDFKKYDGGPRPEKTLPTKQGINRFNWDLKRASLPGVDGVFILGNYAGSYVAPGAFKLRLTWGDQQVEQYCTVLQDPRLDSKPEDFAAQQSLLIQIEDKVKDIHESVNRMRDIKEQLSELTIKLKKADCAQELIDMGEDVINRIAKWETKLIQPDQKTFQDVINFPNKLSAEFINLKGRVDTHAPSVTKGAKDRFADLSSDWESHKVTMNQILEEDVPKFNQAYRENDIPALLIPVSTTY